MLFIKRRLTLTGWRSGHVRFFTSKRPHNRLNNLIAYLLTKEKEIRNWIDKLNYEIKELESQLNRHSSVNQEKYLSE